VIPGGFIQDPLVLAEDQTPVRHLRKNKPRDEEMTAMERWGLKSKSNREGKKLDGDEIRIF